MKGYRTLWPYFHRHRYRLAAGLAALMLVDFFQLVIPRVVKHAVDLLSTMEATPGSLALAGVKIVGLAAAIGFFRYFWRFLILGFSRIVEEDLRNRLYAKLLTLSPAWFLTRTTGDIMALATNDLEAVRMSAGMGLVALTDSVLLGAAAIGFMIWINPLLTLLVLIPMPLITILTKVLSARMFRRYLRVQDIFGRLTENAREYLDGIRVITAHVKEDLVVGEMDRVGREYVNENIRLNRVSGAFFPLMIMFTNLSLAIVLYFGGRLTIFAVISPGDFVAFISYLGLLTWPMMALGWVTNLVQRGAASLGRLNSVLEEPPEITDPPAPERIEDFRGGVIIRGLTFRYPRRENPVFRDLSLDCPPGRVTAVVGRTGSGKSTLVNLVLRLFDPPPDTVLVDGVDVRRISLADLRTGVGWVPQDGYIFSGTVAENISFGRPGAAPEEIEAAARAAQLDEEIALFPQGYQTQVGERGITLSGGQRQRLSLARALLLDPPLLILDDTLSAVDAEVEERIVASLARTRSGRTTLVVSHRLTSLREAHLIHVIEDGRVSESGAPEELLKRGGYFARLYRLQQVQAEYGSGKEEAA
ncbi:MAG: ABC transporter ATP-binding protein [Thermodesulfobacteriota bacterium]